MKPKDVMAINKAVSSKAVKSARGQMEEGRYEVDALVRVVGEVVVGADTEKTATSSLMSVDFLLLTLKAAGVTREAAMKAIRGVAGDYLQGWTGSKEDKKAARKARFEALSAYDSEGAMKEIFDKAKASLPKVPVKGAVKFEGTVEQFEMSARTGQIDKAITASPKKGMVG